MKKVVYEKLKLVITDYIMNNKIDEPMEDKLKVLNNVILFIDGYEERDKGYQLRKEDKQ